MSLTPSQRLELNRAIAQYLKESGHNESYNTFVNETELQGHTDNKYKDLLKRKWTTIVRLNKKIRDLEGQLKDVKDEVNEVSTKEGLQRRQDPSQWFPRPPFKYTLSGHRSPITCVLFHPTYSNLITASEDATIKLWDSESGEFERTLKGHTGSVNSLSLQPGTAKILASCSADMTIKLWDFTSGEFECLKTLKGHDHNVSNINFINTDLICSASRDNTIKIWKVDSGFCINTLNVGHTDWIRKVVPSPCKRLLASCSLDQSIKIWDLDKKDLKCDLREHTHVVEDVTWANEASYKYIETNETKPKSETPAELNATSPSKMSKYLVSASRDKTIKVWDIQTASLLFNLLGHDNWVRQVKFMPLGRYLISVSDDKSIKTWDLENKRCHKTLQNGHDHFISCLDVHKKGHKIVTGGVDKQINLWLCR